MTADSRQLVVCCDGTGNLWSPGGTHTNVLRLFGALSRDERQLSYYDPGVGSPDGAIPPGTSYDLVERFGRLRGLALGRGIFENVAQAYLFLMRNYEPGSKIFLFGFSRGAFTARAVSGLVNLFGILKPHHEPLIPTLLRIYFANIESSAHGDPRKDLIEKERFRERLAIEGQSPTRTHFVGAWDTVDSVGLFFFKKRITSHKVFDRHTNINHVRHALALEENRWAFKPRVYELDGELRPDQSFKQVWFAGAHSDVGGGYAPDIGGTSLSHVALHWMVAEAADVGLRLQPHALIEMAAKASPVATRHDEIVLAPLWTAGAAVGRRIAAQSVNRRVVLHESVLARAEAFEDYQLPHSASEMGVEPGIAMPGMAVTRRADPEPQGPPHHEPVVRPGRKTWWALGIATLLAAGYWYAAANWFDLPRDGLGWGAPLELAQCQVAGVTRWMGIELPRNCPDNDTARKLLWADFGFIGTYAWALFLASFFALWGLGGSKRPGRLLTIGTWALPLTLLVADLLEDVLWLWALNLGSGSPWLTTEARLGCCEGPVEFFGCAVGFLARLTSLTKTISATAMLLLVLVGMVCAVVRIRSTPT